MRSIKAVNAADVDDCHDILMSISCDLVSSAVGLDFLLIAPELTCISTVNVNYNAVLRES